MGFSIRIMPGVRVRASSRGLSAGVGPRIARVHVGTRGVGVSSGVGPVSAYSHLGGGRRRSSRAYGYSGGSYARPAGPSRTTLQALERAQRQAEKAEQVRQAALVEEKLVKAHKLIFPAAKAGRAKPPELPSRTSIQEAIEAELEVPALVAELGGKQPVQVPLPEKTDVSELLREEWSERRKGVSIFRRSARQQARAEAEAAAERRAAKLDEAMAEAVARQQAHFDDVWQRFVEQEKAAEERTAAKWSELLAEAEKAHARQQAALDEEWERLTSNDPPTVISALEKAFADNGAPATPIDCHDATATVTMLFGHPDEIPDQRAAITPGGKPTLKRRTKTERNALYLASMASNVLATVKEGLAVCPGLEAIEILVVRRDPSPGQQDQLSAIYAATFTKDLLDGIDWQRLDPAIYIHRPSDSQIVLKGRTDEVRALDLHDEPELQEVLERLAETLGIKAAQPPRGQAKPSAPAANSASQSRPASATRRTTKRDRLLRQLESDDWDKRFDAVTGLRDLEDPSLIDTFMKLTEDDDDAIRQTAVGALASLEDQRCKPVLLSLAADADKEVRYEAISGLRDLADPSLAATFVKASQDTDRYVRNVAVGALADYDEPTAQAVLRRSVTDADPEVRYAAISGMREHLSSADADLLLAAVEDHDEWVRAEAVSALGELADPIHAGAAISLLDDPVADVRSRAAYALADIGAPGSQEALASAADDPDPDVRDSVQQAQEQLTPG